MPTHSALKTKITTPLLAICCKTPLPLVAWGYEMQTLTGIANKVWELPLCIPLWNNFPKIKILLYKLLFELQCWPWIYQSMCHSSESLLDCTVNIVPSERKSNQKLCIVLLWTAWPALYLLSAFVNQSLIVKFPKTNPDSAALAAQSKFAGDIIKSSKFPAAQAPQPDETAKIETDYWPCPPSLAALGRLLPLAPPGRLAFWEACKKQTQRQNNDLGNVSTVCLVDMTHHFLSGRSSSLWGVV